MKIVSVCEVCGESVDELFVVDDINVCIDCFEDIIARVEDENS